MSSYPILMARASCLCSATCVCSRSLFFFNDTATTEIYTLSLHDALPISSRSGRLFPCVSGPREGSRNVKRSEEHTSELQSLTNLVCRLLLEKKKINVKGGIERHADEG